MSPADEARSSGQPSPIELLERGVASLVPHLQPDGTLHDPVFGCPTQYGTAYLAWCETVLASRSGTRTDPSHRDHAELMLPAVLNHTADPDAEPYASSFDRRTLAVTGRLNHRDFTWPPLLKTYLGLVDLGVEPDARITTRLAGVDVQRSFRSRPPSNWAAVWLSGEWLRLRAGLSPSDVDGFDDWLDVFFAGGEVGCDVERGLYVERGLPNAYDLFTRVHLLDLLLHEYDGRNRARLEAFLAAGLRRSLHLQLSDGSVASGFRSTGQTWVLGAQLALFSAHRALGLGSTDDLASAGDAAWRAYGSLVGWQRDGGVFSPVQNRLPPEHRVGYEAYTADGHYSPLALGFLASALVAGFGVEPPPTTAVLDARPDASWVEDAPTWRGVAHRGRVSVGVHTQPDETYDAVGLVDLSLGSGRSLQLVSTARHLAGGPRLVPGLALRDHPGLAAVDALCARRHRLTAPLRTVGTGLAFGSTICALDETTGPDLLVGQPYRFSVALTDDGVEVSESTPGLSAYRTLLVPYLVDAGTGPTTTVETLDRGIALRLGDELIEVGVVEPVERITVLPVGYESRRGWCGLVRIDLVERSDVLRWRVSSA